MVNHWAFTLVKLQALHLQVEHTKHRSVYLHNAEVSFHVTVTGKIMYFYNINLLLRQNQLESSQNQGFCASLYSIKYIM
jgi:hypothetical protein